MRCVNCELGESCVTPCIPGKGHSGARVVLVGQAPGGSEDDLGEIFVGPAGRLLTETLDRFGIKGYRLENAVRCFPKGDKIPTRKQIDACRPHLLQAITKVDPDILVVLGKVAAQSVLGSTPGDLFSSVDLCGRNRTVLHVIHPAAVLHAERNEGAFLSGIHVLRELLRDAPQIRSKPKYELTGEPFVWSLSVTGEEVAIDIETKGGLDPKAKDTSIRCIGASVRVNQCCCLDNTENVLKTKDLKTLDNMSTVIAHNAKFEYKWLSVHYGIEPHLTDDTAIMAHLLYESYPTNLETTAAIHTDMTSYKSGFNSYMSTNKLTYDTVDMEHLYPYNCRDCDATLRAYRSMMPKIRSRGMERLYREVEIPTMRTLAHMELAGMKIDKAASRALVRDGLGRLKDLTREIIDDKDIKKRAAKVLPEFNPGSAVQMAKLLFDIYGFPASKNYGRSTAAEALDDMAAEYDHRVFSLIKEYRGISHGISDIESIQKSLDAGGFISCDYTQTYVVTGRLSSRNPNLQNLPNPKETERDGERFTFGDSSKSIFVSRFGINGEIVCADYAQFQLRITANETKDETMINALNNDRDLHEITARSMVPNYGSLDKGAQKEIRRNAKRVNFGVVFNIGPKELSKQTRKPLDECKGYLDAYDSTYPCVRLYMEELWDFCRENGFVVSKFGRRRYLPNVNSPDWGSAKRAMNQAGNFPIASLDADLAKWAMATVDSRMRSEGMRSVVITQTHDSITIDAHKKELASVKDILQDVMVDEAMSTWPFTWSVPLKIDVSHGPNWLDQEEL